MKKILYACIIACWFISPIWGNEQTFNPYKIKAQFIGGYLYPHDKSMIEPLTNGPMLGGEVAFEWGADGSKDWHQAFNNPDVGMALQVIDLGNPKVAGQMIGLYPYINLPMVKNDIVSFNVKIGGGLGFATKPCNIEAAIADPRSMKDKAGDYNFAIGGPVSFAITAGINVDVKVHPNVALTADFAYNHFSSASLFQPNSGLNMLNGYLGLKYLINKEITPNSSLLTPHSANPSTSSGTETDSPTHQLTESPFKRWSGEIIVSGSAKKLYYQDTQYFGCASLNVEGYYHTCRQHRIGVGLDLFFDDAYCQTVAPDANGTYQWTNEYTKFKRTCTPDNNVVNKLRLGFNIANELTIGRVGIFAQFGIYLYDPVKNMEPGDKALDALNGKQDPIKKGLFYAYDIQEEDGWNYFRVGVKYHVTPHFLLNVSFKTHLQKVEFAEFGIGYSF
ncbi:MAG: acyloxyacyl hydrolase [Paludibacteraceae bacterium]|nr:acyloxyacyl hydrolase [Paludibacteraceae bacterium]